MSRATLRVVHRLQEHGHQALLAGGCVRDLLLGCEPHDYDVATSAHPGEVTSLFSRTVPVGAQFGVILVVEDGFPIQVATFRSDGVYVDGRHPGTVTFATAREDALRRDFTINGLFFDPANGEVLDYVGGRADLEAGVLRAIGKAAERIHEDKLRLLRAVRFSCRFGFPMEKETWGAVCEAAPEIRAVSAERIREELNRIFMSPGRVDGFDLLDRSGLLAILLPEITALKGCEQPPEFHPEGDVFVHTRLMLSLLPPETSAVVVWSVLLHDIGKPATARRDENGRWRFNGHESVSARMAEEILLRLRFSNQEISDIVEVVQNHMVFKDVQNMRKAKLKRFLARPTFAAELELHRVDCLGCHGLLDNYHFLLAKQEEFSHEPLIPAPLVTGHDLITCGYRPGPLFKTILDAVQTRQLEGTLTSSAEALDWVREEFPPANR
jgi:putative nucleotidyltransferase with HDIG domain